MPDQPQKKKCFVVMGFGEKPDYATARTLDLDKSYRIIIKRAVEEAGLECIRADDVIHSGTIDKPMYDLLLNADLVIADLSTSNANALYELGIRHALRPYTTIVIAESQFKFPFDLTHLVIRQYEHLGKGIDSEVAEAMRENLKKAIHELIDKEEIDSPFYVYMPDLAKKQGGSKSAAESAGSESASAQPAIAQPAVAAPPAASNESKADDQTSTELMELFTEARADGDWKAAVRWLKKLLQKRPEDEYLKQQLALATYKSKKPDPITALEEAKKILQELKPEQTTDPETLGLWGAVHKRLWELTSDSAHLDQAIWGHEKGFYLKNDYYNGINLAFLFNARASVSPLREAIADFVMAERVRRRIIPLCEKLLSEETKKDIPDKAEVFWLRATLVEALTGVGESEKADPIKETAIREAPESWMPDSLNEQLGKLQGYLANPPAI